MSIKLPSPTPVLERPELRKDYIQNKYVLIAPVRNLRPHPQTAIPEECPLVRPEDSPFSPQRINAEPPVAIVGSRHHWKIYVVKNKFAAVTLDNPRAYGTQEVVIETPNPNIHLEDLPIKHVADLLGVYAKRTKALSRLPRIQYILIFKNAGGRAGASLCHAHSQIYALEFVPPQILDKSQHCLDYRRRTERCLYCDVIIQERKGPRLVWEDEQIIAFTPYASMHNYEVWVLPKRHRDNITQLTAAERYSYARILKKLLFSINHRLFLPYNYYFHQLINDTDQHLYLKIVPRGSTWAGVEIGSGLIINPIPPETAAEFYRQQVKSIH